MKPIRGVFIIALFMMHTNLDAKWVAHDPGFDESMHVVSYSVVDSTTIWVASGIDVPPRPASLTYSRTTDGGRTWQTASPSAQDVNEFHITSIFALSDSVAWLTLAYNSGVPHRGKILKTIDAGQTWVHQSTAYPELPGHHNDPDFTFFFNEEDGISAGDLCEMYRTSDGGTTWSRVQAESMPAVLDNEDPLSSSYCTAGDSTLWYGTSKGRVFRTSDRGQTWTASDLGFGQTVIFLAFEDALVGLATAPFVNSNIAKTTDGGFTWETLPSSVQTPTRSILSYVTGTTSTYMYSTASIPAYLGTNSGSGFTSDDGESWYHENEMSMLPGMWVDSTYGWSGNANDNKIYRWTNDTIPPGVPQDLSIWFRIDGPVTTMGIDWSSPADTDISFFRVYSSTNESFTENVHVIYETQGSSYVGVGSTQLFYRLSAVDINGNESEGSEILFWVPTSVDSQLKPSKMSLVKNVPNPFNPFTTISYGIPVDSNVSLVIYDVRGQVIQTLQSGPQAAGWYDVVWNGETADGETISTGIYFARLVGGEYSPVIKMIYLK